MDMKIFSWNVNGLRAATKKGLVDWIKEEQPDILCIQESRANLDQLPKKAREIEGYKFFINSGDKKGYSGTAVYYKKDPNNIIMGLPDERFNDEGRTTIFEYDDFVLFNIYFPNGQSSDERLEFKMDFYDEFLRYSNELVAEGKKVIACGDYNTAHQPIDLKNDKANANRSGFLPIEREWIDKYIDHGYIDTFRYLHPDEVKYSWWTYRFNARKNNAGWRIDYFFISENMKDQLISAEIHNDVFGSDHCPISIEIKE
jgi:exodeoxyribonuclease-3